MFTDWPNYRDLLDKLWAERSKWQEAATLVQLDEQIERFCPDLVGGNDQSVVGKDGYAALRNEVAADYSSDDDGLATRIQFAALCRPAADYELDPDTVPGPYACEWYGEMLWSEDRYAEYAVWSPLPAPVEDESEEDPGEGEGEAVASELEYSDRFRLWYDSKNWYLDDKTTVVVELHDRRGYFVDSDGDLYHQGRLYDETTGLLYDDANWYLRDAVTVVTEDPEIADYFRDSHGRQYLRGEPADLAVQHFHLGAQRWRRRSADGVFEFYDETTNSWERPDEPAPDEPAEAEAVETAEPVVLTGQETETARLLHAAYQESVRATISQLREDGVTADDLSDDDIAGLFDETAHKYADAE